jgi:Flp pilus assembly protein TadD
MNPPRRQEVVRYASLALALRDSPAVWVNLGTALRANGQLEEAVRCYQKAARLKPDFPTAHNNLGVALLGQGKAAEAVAACREAIRLQPDYHQAHNNLGAALLGQGKPAEAEAAYREAVRLQPDYHQAHNNLGAALSTQGKVAEAEAAYREAVRLQPDYPEAFGNLGLALRAQGRLAEAVTAFQGAICLNPDLPQAHFNLGLARQAQGRFGEALASLRQGHQLGRPRPGWPSASIAALIRQAERLVELDRDLPAFLAGKRQPSGPEEQLELASLCRHPAKHLYAAATRFSAGAFAARPALSDGLRLGHRYNAACCAALAGCGRGEDKPNSKDEELANLRQQALGWLRADLEAWAKVLDEAPLLGRPMVQRTLTRWRADANLAGVRDKGELARLPDAERAGWRKLWAEVAALLKRAEGK